jgi:hypothetical protein
MSQQYTFLAVAPCTFMLEGKRYDLVAGQPLTVNESIAQKLLSNTFQYRNFLNLVAKPVEPEPKKEVKAKAAAKPPAASPLPVAVTTPESKPVAAAKPEPKKEEKA